MTPEIIVLLLTSLLLNLVMGGLILVLIKKPKPEPTLSEILIESFKSDNEVKALSNQVKKVKLLNELRKLIQKGKKT